MIEQAKRCLFAAKRCLIAALMAVAAAPALAVDVWITSGNRSRLLEQQPDVVLRDGFGTSGSVVSIDTSQTFQEMDGYGAAMTNSSASLLQNGTTETKRSRAMRELFSTEDGIGLNYLRLAMGSSDFTADGFYTYNDLPPGQTDGPQANFSIDADRGTILPSLDEARAHRPDLKLMGSPWSAPAWMKTNGLLFGGSLAPQWHASYATYLRRFVEAYAAEGHTIDALTLQNEPLFTPGNYPGMFMSAVQQIDLIKNHVGPELAAAGLATELYAYDHNWDNTAYPIQVLDDPGANAYLAGSAFHGYAGDVSAQTVVRNAHPDKKIQFTEITGGDFAPNFEDNLVWYARNLLIGVPRNWGSSVLLWNLALDENGDPHLGGCDDCRGVVTIDSQTGDVTANEEFYALGHASGHVRPGAVRVASTSINNFLETVAFKNPDGSRVLIALNPTQNEQLFRGVDSGRHFQYALPARSVGTFVWDESGGADFDNGGFERGGYDATGGSLDGWLAWGVNGNNVEVTDADALVGEHALRLSGAGPGGFSGVSQGVSVAGGDEVRIDASVLLPTFGSIAGGSDSVLMKVEFYDAYGGQFQGAEFLAQSQLEIANGQSGVGQWVAHTVEAIAPQGAAEARLVFVFSQGAGGPTGEVLIDGVSFVTTTPLAGDFNGDGLVNAADYTVWRDEAGTTGGALSADANGDGAVDGDDYAVWRDNFGRSEPAAVALPEAGSATLTVLGAAALSLVGARTPRVAATR